MLPAKYLNGNAVLAIPAYAVTQVKSKEEPKPASSKGRKAKTTKKNTSKADTVKNRELCGV